jgi:glucose/arabinose dehydrogenase
VLRRTVLLPLLAAALIPASAHAYTVPPDNPFVGDPSARPEIYAYGLRNPFRWSFDRESGDLTIGDVGQDAREEIDFVPAGDFRGANFGWDCYEGDQSGDGLGTDPLCAGLPASATVQPVYAYDTAPSPHAVTGGVIVRDATLAALDGQYVFGDFYDGEILRAHLQAGLTATPTDTGMHVAELVAFGQDAAGHAYPVSLAGHVYRLAAGPSLSQLPQTFDMPMYVTSPSNDPHRLFVVERSGDVRVLVDGMEQPAPFLDIHAAVSQSGERGMSTIAFPPDYATSGHAYVYYTDISGNIRVDQFTRSACDPNQVDPATQVNVLTIPHPDFSNHYGGQMNFGPDGYLYISTGDGGGSNDPDDNAQNLNVLLGKLLRIDPTTAAPPPTSCGGAPPLPGTTAGPGPRGGDHTPPRIVVGRNAHQHVLRTHYLRISVTPSEAATITARATVHLGVVARVLRFRTATRRASAHRRVVLKLRLSKTSLRKLRRAFRHRHSFVARVTVTARDAAGNTGSARRAVRLLR